MGKLDNYILHRVKLCLEKVHYFRLVSNGCDNNLSIWDNYVIICNTNLTAHTMILITLTLFSIRK